MATSTNKTQISKAVHVLQNGKWPCSNYLQAIMPPPRRLLQPRYNTRNMNDLHIPRTRLERYRNSFVPRTTHDWNLLSSQIKAVPSLSLFKQKLKESLFPLKNKLLGMHSGSGAINHSRIRMGLSALNSQRADYSFIDHRNCPRCRAPREDIMHFFLECPHYSVTRGKLIRELGHLLQPAGVAAHTHNQTEKDLLISTILHGHPSLKLETNLMLFFHIQTYSTDSKRF